MLGTPWSTGVECYQPTSHSMKMRNSQYQTLRHPVEAPPKKICRALRLVGWNTLGIVLALILGEVTLRRVGIEFVLYPTKIQWGRPNPVAIHSQYTVDRQLFWVPRKYSFESAYWKGRRPTIVFMGDSCTQFGIYHKFLKSMITERNPEGAFTSVVVGVGGWSSYQGLRQLERDVVPMKPRAVTIYYGWNDHWVNYGLEDKMIGEIYRKHPPLLLELSSSIRMAALINQAIFALRAPIYEQQNKGSVRVSLPDFSANLRQMVHIALDNGIIPILLTAPTSHRRGKEPRGLAGRWLNDLSDLIPLHQQYVQAVRDVAAQHQAPLIDLYAAFNRLPQEDLERFFWRDGIHLSKEGDEKLAEMIYTYLSQTDLLGRIMELQPE